MKELINIQSKLKAPKNQRNTFGGYSYRSCEDILEAVKPLLEKEKCTLTISDAITVVGDRIYVEATATLKNSAGDAETTKAYAREPLSKKGMDDSQVTGAASSYARKYALNGLFCIDDTKDADATNNGKNPPSQQDEALEEAFQLIKANIEKAPSRQYLADLHKQNEALHNYAPYRILMNKRFKEVQ